ncbi:MAG: hypothetical protein OEM97_02395 [Acidimicrobiia bacterium]|nr:hypothetical protein [Acidimicrobiia bacterium]
MAATIRSLTRPAHGADNRPHTKHRTLGLALGLVGVVLVLIALVGNISAANATNEASAAQTLAWTFGLTVLGFGTVKFGIAVILVGILVRLWLRVDSVEASLPALRAASDGNQLTAGQSISTAFGPAVISTGQPKPLTIHRMAGTMWAPMLAMGAMALVAGFVLSLVWSAQVGNDESAVAASAWTQGLQFLGEGFLLSGISFLLGSILASLREGGASVQESVGIVVQTLKMPGTAKIFVVLMMTGLMVSITQFVLYLVVAAGVDNPGAWFAWLGPFRELGLGLLLSGIVMALVTIGNVLGFQFHRIREICAVGR